ncbi:MFS transporter [Streptoalloteichus hindustanus]|uniref:Major Facilitator Superfamily protein n=1 Tax=Streptoalloteichus hindustanus TaxID=2017 RepID=A0A1M4V1M8_STRHI|nr:MFS transporter [Streptoalloteichus hindustanus]SHE62802.1 Major Facilitator Superfamily protein [Streptoalloteichus hindustanus]
MTTAAGSATSPARKVGARRLFAGGGFRRLLLSRLTAQWGDGVFQAGLGGAVLFNPERQADPAAVAAGLAVLLLPYSVIGPFAGALLDRWDRRRVLVAANLLRGALVVLTVVAVGTGMEGVPLYAGALLVMGVSRFVGAGLSASLPHVVDRDHLVEANALAATLGAVAAAVGGACAIGLRGVVGADNAGSAVVTAVAVVGSAVAALVAAGFARGQLGPDEFDEPAQTMVAVAHGLGDGARAVARTPSVAAGFVALMAHRLVFGASTLAGVLLMRYAFGDDGLFRSGMAGVGQAVAAGAAGMLVAAVVTAPLVNRFGRRATITAALLTAATAQLCVGLVLSLPTVVVVTFFIAGGGQVVKLCVDAAVQQDVGDEVRGRVFALYDTLFNSMYVLAISLTAIVLPQNGYAPGLLVAVASVYLIGMVGYLAMDRRSGASRHRP